jgi:hypothetical protein
MRNTDQERHDTLPPRPERRGFWANFR